MQRGASSCSAMFAIVKLIERISKRYWNISQHKMGLLYWVVFHAFCRLLFISKSTTPKNSFRNTIRVSISLGPDQTRSSVGSDLAPNCLQWLSAEYTSRQRLT